MQNCSFWQYENGLYIVMISWQGDAFHTGFWKGNPPMTDRFLLRMTSNAELSCFPCYLPRKLWTNNRMAIDLKRTDAQMWRHSNTRRKPLWKSNRDILSRQFIYYLSTFSSFFLILIQIYTLSNKYPLRKMLSSFDPCLLIRGVLKGQPEKWICVWE